MSRDLVVVGAGIVGASVAYHAARAGAAVTLVDAGPPGAGVTANSFAWIGASGVRTGPAAGLRATATEEYHRLEAELPGLPVTWSGSLCWGAADSAPDAGPGQTIVDAATVATLEPTLRQPPEWAVWAPGDGAVDPVGVTERLVAGARAHGARVHLGHPGHRGPPGRRGPDCRGGDGRRTPLRRDGGAGGRSRHGRAGRAARRPRPGRPVAVAAVPAPRPGRSGPHRGQHRGLRSPAGRRGPADRRRGLARTDPCRRPVHVPWRRDVELLSTRVGARPMPADGEPIVGPVAEVPGLYLAVMHSAVTLAAAVGRLVARELVDGTVEPALSGCRPDRFG